MPVGDGVRRCFKCGGELELVHKDTPDQCHGGVTFETHGNYGSTVFDPVDATMSLVIVICDDCLVAGRTEVAQLVEKRQLPTYERVAWII